MAKFVRLAARDAKRDTRQPLAPGVMALAHAAQALSSIAHAGRSADEALLPYLNDPERAAIRAITLGSVRWYLRLAPAIQLLLNRPDEALAPLLRALLVAAAHQIEYSRNPPQSVVHRAVDAARVLKQQRAAGLINAVLRRFVAERATLWERVDVDLAARSAHPEWLVRELQQAWPEHAEAILLANNRHPPMMLRLDRTKLDPAVYLAEITAAGLSGEALKWLPSAIRLDRAVPVAAIPGFAQGYVSVQDAGAQVAVALLDARPGMRVLDACAAPGGKTGHLLEHTPDLKELVAVDIDAARMARVRENLKRLGRSEVRLEVANARDAARLKEFGVFERILVDAPCSSVGVIRRHPDIKLLRRASDIGAFAETQLAILRACFSVLAPGGRLLYATCSVLPQENEDIVSEFLATEAQARPVAMLKATQIAPGAIPRPIGVQLLPGAPADSDGFYYAVLERPATL